MIDELRQGESELRGIFSRFRRRDFSGNEGQAIKNSTFQLATTIVAKIGSLIFTILVARMLMPELFGLYSLALGTIIFFSTFADLGVGSALITFVSRNISEKKLGKAKYYFKVLLKYKVVLIFIPAIVLLVLSRFIASTYYNKPIFFALVVGAIYIPLNGMINFLNSALNSLNNFKAPLIREIIFQILRISLIPLMIYLFLKTTSPSVLVAILILTLSFCYCIALIYLAFITRRKFAFFKKEMPEKISPEERKKLIQFLIPLSITALSGMFFGFIDTLMLGHYVDATNIGYYSSAFGLIGAAGALLTFMGSALLPIFSRLKSASLEKVFRKSVIITTLICIPAAIFTFFAAKYILLIYGAAYLPAVPLLKLFSIFLLVIPLIALYEAYFISTENTKNIAILLVCSTVLNIILNYFFINYGLKFGMFEALIGAGVATILSRAIYLLSLTISKKILLKNNNL